MDSALLISGVAVGAISGFFGVGGGTILVPVLLFLGFDIKDAIGISVVQMVFSSIFGSFLNFRKGTLKISSTIFFGFGGFLGGLLSGYVVHTLSSRTLTLIFLGVVLFAIYRFFHAPAQSDKPPIENRLLFLSIGIVIGIFATSVGIGGALILTPVMVGFLHYHVKEAVSAALFFVTFSSVAGLVSLSRYGYVDWSDGFVVGVTSLIGVYIGIHFAHKTDPKRHKNLILILNFVILALIVNKLLKG
ncbi:MAG TPA: sulfite exporter TauE/SafE family protein [Campylobacteraceae bacterium]|nr:sulfite exporter TauE/SafE family protein [Campylobacteraceae bacterium]